MKQLSVCFLFVLSPLALDTQDQAQTQVKTEPMVVINLGTLPGNGCPIGMVANQGIWDHTFKVRDGQQEKAPQQFGQRISLTLADSHPSPIDAATVKVHGLTGKNHIVQAADGASEDGNATRIMRVKFATSEKSSVTGDLYLPGFTSVTSIELLQLSYEDGKSWRIGTSSGCRVTPDPLMLIANH